ncbi:transglutaminase family protein [Pseudomonas matsuisoli]|uniref:Protein-glutamine gamma-glutamyltransferase n=1 Tax=Pseudomonas matsuisoli TaxID=1515666 RepID=A0A917Q0U4_9PSED|nr:DUF3488 and transglutaminase-like domain-containing protein [Pseudomonas matsuisoli]GGK05737.1 protein-glutamine gamma-glutamyltransferase [Pseudomonas matsuisoli]
MSKKPAMEQAIPRASLTWLLVAQFLVILPHLGHLPLWISALWIACAYWRIQVYRMRARFPSALVKAALMVGTIAGVYLSRGGLVGLDAAVVLLVAAFILKLVEVRTRRDALVLIYLGFFTVLTRYLFDSEILTAAFSLLPVAGLLSALVGLQHSGVVVRPWSTLKLAMTLMLQAVPLMLVLFLFFPRLGPLWSLPQPSERGVTGLSDSMAPGEIAELSRSGGLAFRASFDDPVPARNQLYWRALTFDRFDGRRWTQTPQGFAAASPDWQAVGDPVRYSVIMERSAKPWLFALDVAQSDDDAIRRKSDFRLERTRPVERTFFYRATSWIDARLEPESPSAAVRRALQLPATGEPRARGWAQELRRQYSDDRALAEAVLRQFREQPYVYTLRPPTLEGDAIDAFLFDTRRGFCEHYAGAMTFVLRAANIPARVVTGYQGGELNTAGNYLQVRQFDAHAWVEYWIEGAGWVRADPTFQVAPDRIERGLEEAVSGEQSFLEGDPFSPLRYRHLGWINTLRLQWDELNYGWQRWVLDYQAEQQGSFLQRIMGHSDKTTLIGIVLLGGLVVLGALAIWIIKPWRRRLAPLDRAFSQFERLLQKEGVQRLPAEGPRTYAARAAQALPAAANEIRGFSRAYEQQCYETDDAHTQPLSDALRALRRSLGKGATR